MAFRLPGGERIGGSRLLLAHVSPYYENLLFGGMAEGTSYVEPDPDFSSAAHLALLGQLHALDHAALPASLDVRLELLCLAAKVRGAPSGEEGGGADAAVRVFERCERALRESLCAGNCLAVLLRLKPYAAEMPGLVDAAHAVVVVHVVTVLKQPEWKEFRKQYPDSASDILEDIAFKQGGAAWRATMMLFVTMLLLPSCESAGEIDDQGCRHAETTIKATKTTTTMRLPTSRAGVAPRGSRLHAETTIKTSKTTTTTEPTAAGGWWQLTGDWEQLTDGGL
ncbi:hypothetical protein T492DRAFT_893657 [Pavlovales sp. CCMP2436]|nr:hypothetical protein T492DRAFT_893657 [Pavlovales sp. CCMP2436]